jgi:hypothetical protein
MLICGDWGQSSRSLSSNDVNGQNKAQDLTLNVVRTISKTIKKTSQVQETQIQYHPSKVVSKSS